MDLKELKIKRADSARHPWEEVRAEVICSLIKKNFPDFPGREIKVLDIGCGDIYLIEQLSLRFPHWKFFAADNAFSDQDLEYFKDKFKGSSVSVFNSLEEAGSHAEKVDLALLLDVIEHIEQDKEFLTELATKNFLNQSLYLISAPAFQSLFSTHDLMLGHYRRYTVKSLRESIQRAGFQIQNSGYFFFSLLPVRRIQKIFESDKKHINNKGVAGWKGGPTLSWLFRNMLRLDYFISSFIRKLGIRLPGLSTYAICKKPA